MLLRALLGEAGDGSADYHEAVSDDDNNDDDDEYDDTQEYQLYGH